MTRSITERTEALLTEAGSSDLEPRIQLMEALDPRTVEEQEALDRARVAHILSRREPPQS
ncbi:MAG: hypothetical protein PHU04_00245 [Candidatus Peribacteraceae bacterium]|nr:hypothetical protein [Candidatus Peribacteraceae bacterium]